MLKGFVVTNCKLCDFRIRGVYIGCIHPKGFRRIDEPDRDEFPEFCPLNEIETIIKFKAKDGKSSDN